MIRLFRVVRLVDDEVLASGLTAKEAAAFLRNARGSFIVEESSTEVVKEES